jgi:hypothetical protein
MHPHTTEADLMEQDRSAVENAVLKPEEEKIDNESAAL